MSAGDAYKYGESVSAGVVCAKCKKTVRNGETHVCFEHKTETVSSLFLNSEDTTSEKIKELLLSSDTKFPTHKM